MITQTIPVAPDREPVSHPVALLPAMSESTLAVVTDQQAAMIAVARGYFDAGMHDLAARVLEAAEL